MKKKNEVKKTTKPAIAVEPVLGTVFKGGKGLVKEVIYEETKVIITDFNREHLFKANEMGANKWHLVTINTEIKERTMIDTLIYRRYK